MTYSRRSHLALLLLEALFSFAMQATNVVAQEQPIPLTFFGMHIGQATQGTPWPNLPVPAWRLWDSQVKWPDLEPSKGQWRFDKLDKYVTLAEQHNTEILLPLGTTPQWASSLPNVKSGWQAAGFTAPPKDMADWRAYVMQVVTRYKGRIHAYEIWNEPNLKQFWIGNTQQLVEMTKEAHDIIKSVDSGAVLVSPAATGDGPGVSWLTDFLNKGGGLYVDVIGYHCYVFPNPPERMLALIQHVKQTMKDNGVASKPIWDTELGWAAPKPFPSEELAAGYLARAFILNWSAGIQRLYWYMWDNHKWVSIETTTTDNKTLRPAGQAYGVLQKWLSGAIMDACTDSTAQVWTCQVHRGNESEWIVWTSENAGKEFPVPSSWNAQSVTPLLGQPQPVKQSSISISQVPVLVSSSAISSNMPIEPRYAPATGTYSIGQQITLSTPSLGAVIHYTIDGSQPSVNSPVYRLPLVLTTGAIIHAIAVVGNVNSYVASATYTVRSSVVMPEEPRYDPPSGTYPTGQKITLSSGSPGAVIHYTVDGSQPSVNSSVYRAPLVLTNQQIVRAIAVAGEFASYIASATFNVTSTSFVPASFLGLTVLDFTNVSPKIPFGTTRSWDAYPNLDWADINQTPGTYNFAYLDRFIAINQARNTEIIYTLGRTPRWASSDPNAPGPYGPGQCAPPANMSDYQNYLRAIVSHVAGKIKYWELWDVPDDAHLYCGDISTMVDMARIASQVIKGIDPNAMILSPSVTGGPGPAWLSSFLSQGGADYVDIIAFHGYWSAQAEDVVSVISSYRSVMAANGIGEKPLWDTESSFAGFGNISTTSSSQQVAFVAKDYLLHWSMGVSRFVWYSYDGGPIWGGLWNSASGESAAAKAYGEIYRWMVGATLTSPCSPNQMGIWTCPLSRPGGYLAEAVWISNETAPFSVPPQYTEYMDLAGSVYPINGRTITVGDEPILLENGRLP
jgi:GH35 family endo-1,4-beta-xylanase